MARPRISSEKMPVVSFSIEERQMLFIEDLAIRLGVPKSRILREAIDRFMRDSNQLSITPRPIDDQAVA